LQPVNRLPPEIISRVARHLLDPYDDDASSIIQLTHVCRYWRESIVSAPENWTLISSRDEDMAAVCLERARAAPLEISVDMYMEYPRFPNIIAPYFQNTETLAINSIPTLEEFTRMFPNFPQSMPNLRSLTLALNNVEGWDLSIDPFESLTHTLTHLSLINIPLHSSFLRLRTLTELTLTNSRFNLHLDTLLNFLEENHSLESVDLRVKFTEPSLLSSQRPAMMGNQLRYLSIRCRNAMDAQAIISNVPLRSGAHLEIYSNCDAGLNDILSGISTTHLSNLSSPTSMEYQSHIRSIRLRGPNGIFSFRGPSYPGEPVEFVEFPLLPLANVREFRLIHHNAMRWRAIPLGPVVFRPSSFPALETLAIECDINISYALSALLSNPSSSPSLKTLAFLNCDLSEDFMEELTRFASDRKNITTSAWLHRVLIVQRDGRFPSVDSVDKLRRYVTIVDVWMDTKLPTDLT
jgi:hypothetical protein